MRITGLTRHNATLDILASSDFSQRFREFGVLCNAFVDTTILDLRFPILPISGNIAQQSFTTSHCLCTVSKSPIRIWPFSSLSPLSTPFTLHSGISSWIGLYCNRLRNTSFFGQSWDTNHHGTTTQPLSLTFSSASTGSSTLSSRTTHSTAPLPPSSSPSRKLIAVVSGRCSVLRTNTQLT